MAYSTTKSIIVTFEGLAGTQYHAYTVGLRYVSDGRAYYNTIFTGRAWCDSRRVLTVRLDDLLRDYVAHWHSTYDEQNQERQTAYLVSPMASIPPIEDGKQFIITSVRVDCGELYEEIDVWGGFVTPWQNIDLPEGDDGAPMQCNLSALGSGVMPHIPPIATNNMHVGLSIYAPKTGECAIGFNYHRFPLFFNDVGTIRAAWRLSDLFAALQGVVGIDGGTPTSTPTAQLDGGTPTSTPTAQLDGGTPTARRDDTTLTTGTLYFYDRNGKGEVFCIVDDCAADYYVAWETPQGGWTCYRFGGNATIGGAPTATSIQQHTNRDAVISMQQQHTFNLYTEPVNALVYGHLATLKYAREVYVYDSKRDRGFYCNVDGRNIDTMPSHQTKLKAFNITLKEQQHLGL